MRQCRLCRGTEISVIHKGTRDRKDIDVLRCDSCGLVFLSKIETGGSFYADGEMREGIDFGQWRRNTYTDDKRRFDYYKEMIPGKAVLDFGCGNGAFLDLVRVSGNAAKAVGIEQDESSLAELRKAGIHCWNDIASVPPEEIFDIVFLFHVIEHLSEPENILQAIGARLNKNGTIVIETPNAEDALLSYYNCEAFADFTYWSPHIYLYNVETLTALLERAGFVITEMRQIQRYPLANHLRWLGKGLPGGGIKEYQKLNIPELNEAYAMALSELKMCDTLLCTIRSA